MQSPEIFDFYNNSKEARVNQLIKNGINQEYLNKYIRRDRVPVCGLLIDPHRKIENKAKYSNSNIINREGFLRPESFKTASEMRTVLGQSGSLIIKAYLRGIDGPGSSADLLDFQTRLLTNKDSLWLDESPATTAFTSQYSIQLRIEATESEGIEYMAPGYFEGIHERVFSNVNELLNEHGLISMKDLPAYYLKQFGVEGGVRITCAAPEALAKEGGMESSNAFSSAMIAAASRLSDVNLNWSQIIAEGVYGECSIFGDKAPGITGGQGHGASVFGGISTMHWLSGLDADGIESEDNFVVEKETYGALVVPLEQMKETDSIYLCQPGKEFYSGAIPVKPRLASDANFEWTECWKEPVGQKILAMNKKLHFLWREALKAGDHEVASYALNTMTETRLAQNERYQECLAAGIHKTLEGETASKASYLDDYALELYRAVSRAGGGLMAAGAGGPGGMNIVKLPNDIEAEEFFNSVGISLFDETKAEETKQNGGVLKGYQPFKTNDEPIEFYGNWDVVNSTTPGIPRLVFLDQENGAFMDVNEFERKTIYQNILEQNDTSTLSGAKKAAREINKKFSEIRDDVHKFNQ